MIARLPATRLASRRVDERLGDVALAALALAVACVLGLRDRAQTIALAYETGLVEREVASTAVATATGAVRS